MKQCKYPRCTNPVFSSGYCKYHLYMVPKYKAIQQRFTSNGTLLSKQKDNEFKQRKIASVSNKQSIINNELSELKKQLIKTNNGKCFFTGRKDNITLFHILPRGQFPQYQTEKWNLLLATLDVHITWEHGLWKDIVNIPKIKFVMKVIKNKDILYYNRLLTKAKQSLIKEEYNNFINKL